MSDHTVETDGLRPFGISLRFDGAFLSIDYMDESDVERRFCPNKAKLMAEIDEAVATALSEEDE